MIRRLATFSSFLAENDTNSSPAGLNPSFPLVPPLSDRAGQMRVVSAATARLTLRG
jgi:hypothetical protein